MVKENVKTKYEGKTSEQIFEMFGGELLRGNVSKVIRTLISEGYSISMVSKMLGKRYQHVRNVVNEPLKK
jgi:hypothetical protein